MHFKSTAVVFLLCLTVSLHAVQLQFNTAGNRLLTAADPDTGTTTLHPHRWQHRLRPGISNGELLGCFGLVYAVSWGAYIFDQYDTIKEHGSFKNWYQNITKIHFDKDTPYYNLFIHPITGHYIYLFWRSRGLSKIGAFGMASLNVIAFEFLIETTTEIPSIQDIYQTAVLGMLLGISMEQLSLWCHSFDTGLGRFFGYLFNPFTLFKFSSYQRGVRLHPVINTASIGAACSLQF